MSGYCRNRNRLANVITEKQTYGELEKLNYSLIMNYTKPKPRVINTKNKEYLHVYNSLSERYKGGLLIAESDTLSDPISELLCKSKNWKDNDVDIMICRNGFASMTKDEMQCANLLRISADPDFNPGIFQEIDDVYKHQVLSLMICQFFVNDQYDTVNRYMNLQNEKYSMQGISDYIDYYELNKQLAYFLYYDVAADKILNVDKATLEAFLKKMSKEGFLPIPEIQIEPLAEALTV
jgi:hypothetical protein